MKWPWTLGSSDNELKMALWFRQKGNHMLAQSHIHCSTVHEEQSPRSKMKFQMNHHSVKHYETWDFTNHSLVNLLGISWDSRRLAYHRELVHNGFCPTVWLLLRYVTKSTFFHIEQWFDTNEAHIQYYQTTRMEENPNMNRYKRVIFIDNAQTGNSARFMLPGL